MAKYIPPEQMATQQIQAELDREFQRWNDIACSGCQDPTWPDGVNMNLVRNHIIYWYKLLDEKQIDFNTLIPMPKDLDIESGSNNEIGMLLYRLMQKGSAKPNGFIQRILDAQGCWDVFSKDDMQTVTREYRAYGKEIHPDVCKDARATEAMAKLNTMYDAAKGLAAGRGWTTQIGDGAERYRLPGVAGYVTNNLIACIIVESLEKK